MRRAVVPSILLLLPLACRSHAGLTPDERACQVGRGRAVYDMIASEGACIRRCHASAGADCDLAGETRAARCVAGVERRVFNAIFGPACQRDCPACYAGCGPDVAASEVDYSSGLVASFATIVYCADTPTQRSDGASIVWRARPPGSHGRTVIASSACMLGAPTARGAGMRRRWPVQRARHAAPRTRSTNVVHRHRVGRRQRVMVGRRAPAGSISFVQPSTTGGRSSSVRIRNPSPAVTTPECPHRSGSARRLAAQ